MTAYAEFRLRIERGTSKRAYRVQASGPGGEEEGVFRAPFSDTALENFVLKVGRTRRGVRRIESPEMEQAKAFGGELFGAVMDGKVGELYRSSFTEARAAGQGLRVTLSLTDVPELGGIPWEYLYDDPSFLSISTWTPVVRYLDLPKPRRALEVQLPLRILGVVSAPIGAEVLDTDAERARLEAALKPLKDAGAVSIEWLEEATLLALTRKLRPDTFHILHYIGHGGFDDSSGEGALLLEDETGHSVAVSGDQLGTILQDKMSLRLVVLNSCEGARSSVSDPFSGVATGLVQHEIPAVIGMQFEITDRAAVLFAGEFYSMLAEGQPVDSAITEARLAIYADHNDVEWGTPVLFMRVADGRLFDIADAAALPRPDPADLPAAAKATVTIATIAQDVIPGPPAGEASEHAEGDTTEGPVEAEATAAAATRTAADTGVGDASVAAVPLVAGAPASPAAAVSGVPPTSVEPVAVQPGSSGGSVPPPTVTTKGAGSGASGFRWPLVAVGVVALALLLFAGRLLLAGGPSPSPSSTTPAFVPSPSQAPPSTGPVTPSPTATSSGQASASAPVVPPPTPVPTSPGILFYRNEPPEAASAANTQLYLLQDLGADPVRLTTKGFKDTFPVWSPDHTQIAFTRAVPITGTRLTTRQIYVCTPSPRILAEGICDGDASKPLLGFNQNNDDSFPAWSKNGEIAFTRVVGGRYSIRVKKPNEASSKELLPGELKNIPPILRGPAWSPDGTVLVLFGGTASKVRGVATDYDLLFVRANGSGYQRLDHLSSETEAASEFNPNWSPTKPALVFVRDDGLRGCGNTEIYTLDYPGSTVPERLTTNNVQDGNPVWSPDGSMIAFYEATAKTCPTSETQFDLLLMGKAGGIPQPLLPATFDGRNLDPNWR